MSDNIPMTQEFVMPKSVSKEIRLNQDGQSFLYRVYASPLEFRGQNIWGSCQITKYILKNQQESHFELSRLRFKDVSKQVWKQVWQIDLSTEYHTGHAQFIDSNGQPARREGLFSVRNELVGEFANQGMLVSDEFLDICLCPIEQELLELQDKILNYGHRTEAKSPKQS